MFNCSTLVQQYYRIVENIIEQKIKNTFFNLLKVPTLRCFLKFYQKVKQYIRPTQRDNQIPQNLCIYALCEWSKTLWSTFGQFKTSLFAQGGFLFAFMQGTARSVRQFGLLFYAKHQRRCQQLRSHHSDQDAQTRLSGRYRCLRAL